jgi:hypothetical protein
VPTPVSKVLKVSHKDLILQGAFDGFVDVDSRLYVDPHLLKGNRVPELARAYDRFHAHFQQVVKLLKIAGGDHPIFRIQSVRMLTFPEIPNTGLGYAKDDTQGSAIGSGLASQLADLAKAIISAGVEDPEFFELLGLLQEGIGADRISDMTVAVILPDLLAYTTRVCTVLQIPTSSFIIDHQEYHLPRNPKNGQFIVLIPQQLLRDLPVADSWSDIDLVSSHNEDLRHRVNRIIGDTWRHATRRVSKAELRATLLKHPDLLKDLLEQYSKKPMTPYDFAADPAAQQLWYYLSQEEAGKNPLDLSKFKSLQAAEVRDAVLAICGRYKELVERNRLYRIFYNDDGSRRHERIAQLGFFAVADSYCEANGLDLSPEVNSGPGPVDFKVSKGYHARVTVEIKLSSNTDLVHGFEKQLPAYNEAERARTSFFLIVRVDENTSRFKAVTDLRRKWADSGRRVPELIIVDGRAKVSASKA